MPFRHFLVRACLLGFTAAGVAGAVIAQDIRFFRIGTGGTAGTYYPIGGLLANAISNPPGSRACADGGSCGVPGVVATAVATNGSVANINGIQSGQLESGFTQSDVAFWAFTGTGIYDGKPKVGGPAAHRQPVSGKRAPGRAQGRQHQERRRPEGQARVARRAGLGHAGGCAP